MHILLFKDWQDGGQPELHFIILSSNKPFKSVSKYLETLMLGNDEKHLILRLIMKNKLPIGYYLKKADNLLTERINKIHSGFNITRTQWQILSLINENNEVDRQKIIETLAEFTNKEALNDAISTLIRRDLVNENKSLTFTEKGKELFNSCFKKQKAFRQKAMENISEQEYIQIITTLKKIIDNLK